MKIIACALLLVCGVNAFSQHIDNTSTFRKIDRKSYFRLHYDNDFFTKTDYYYSQGIRLEYVHTSIKKWLPSKLLVTAKNAVSQYGINFNLVGYTPTSIKSNNILYGDRPYAACISIQFFASGSDSIRQSRIASGLSIGVMGPMALGKEIQTGIHRWLNNKLPKGWQYQINNDVILNYHFNYEKKIAIDTRSILLNAVVGGNAGTINDNISGGFNFMAGHFNDRYCIGSAKRRKIEYYVFGQSRLNVIAYDASLQGGLFGAASPYTIPGRDIRRLTFQADVGVTLNFKSAFFTYTQSYLTKEFDTGRHHRWGGISFGFSL